MVALKEGYDLAAEILHLKEQRNAIILAHNYQIPEIQDLADYVGDSLGLSSACKKTPAQRWAAPERHRRVRCASNPQPRRAPS